MNLYAYCYNNPISYVDPNGTFPFLITLGLILGGIGLVGVGTYAGVTSYNNGARGWDLVGDIAIGAGIGFGIGFTAGVLIGGGISGALTGSFFSGWTGVKVGAKLVYGMYKAAGLAGAGYMMLDNLGNSFHQVTHVFWSGGDLAKNGAKLMANDVGGKTLEITRLGMYLERTNASYQAWNIASQNFANQVSSGKPVFVLQNLSGVYIYGIWATTEFPILVKKAIDIIYEVIGGAF